MDPRLVILVSLPFFNVASGFSSNSSANADTPAMLFVKKSRAKFSISGLTKQKFQVSRIRCGFLCVVPSFSGGTPRDIPASAGSSALLGSQFHLSFTLTTRLAERRRPLGTHCRSKEHRQIGKHTRCGEVGQTCFPLEVEPVRQLGMHFQ